jgi:hypothetical protein
MGICNGFMLKGSLPNADALIGIKDDTIGQSSLANAYHTKDCAMEHKDCS